MRSLVVPCVATTVACLAAAPVHAACFENLGGTGCTYSEAFSPGELRALSCDALWTVRNSIYNDNGLCFRTAAAQAAFDNSDCYVKDAEQIRLSPIEKANVDTIVAIETEKSCR